MSYFIENWIEKEKVDFNAGKDTFLHSKEALTAEIWNEPKPRTDWISLIKNGLGI